MAFSNIMASCLDKLVDDIVIQILRISSVHAVLSLRKTSRRYYLLSKLRCVWYARFCAEVLAPNLPLPGPACSLSLLSATELERRTLRALHLERVWPRLSSSTLVSGSHQHGVCVGRVDQVMFIPGGTEILTVQGDKVVHWLIVSCPGLAQGLKHIGEWTPLEGVPCRIVKDGEVPGVIAVGSREPLGSQQFAKVASTSLKAPFVTLCKYTRVPGVVTGVWRHLLLLDTTKPGGGGLELIDWHAQTTGTALLPHLLDLFGGFLDFVVFADHILVIWEHCVSVFPVPHIPADGRVFVEHKRAFMFQEAISGPVGFTTCVARHVMPPRSISNADFDCNIESDMDPDLNGRRNQCLSSAESTLPTLSIVGRSRRRADGVSMVMLIPLVDEGRGRVATEYPNTFPYRLAYLPDHFASSWQNLGGAGDRVGGGADDHALRACTTLRLGWSGRGVFVVGRELRLVSPGLHILPPYEMQIGPVFETGEAVYRMDGQRQRQQDLGWLHPDANVGGGADEWSASDDRVDFDEGMGRFVVAKERGGFEVVQLD